MRKPYESIIRNTWQWFNSVDGPGARWLASRMLTLKTAYRAWRNRDSMDVFITQCWTRKHIPKTIVSYVPECGPVPFKDVALMSFRRVDNARQA